MGDVYKCGHCASTHLEHLMVDAQCLSCGGKTNRDGIALPREPQFPAENPHNRRPV